MLEVVVQDLSALPGCQVGDIDDHLGLWEQGERSRLEVVQRRLEDVATGGQHKFAACADGGEDFGDDALPVPG